MNNNKSQENKKWDLGGMGSVELDDNNGKRKMKYIIRVQNCRGINNKLIKMKKCPGSSSRKVEQALPPVHNPGCASKARQGSTSYQHSTGGFYQPADRGHAPQAPNNNPNLLTSQNRKADF